MLNLMHHMDTPYSPMVSGLWIGDELTAVAELCIRSYLCNGIQFQLFTYQDYPNIPEGTIVRPGRGVIADEDIFRHNNGSLAPFADWFRNTFLSREGGFWTDLDMICLKGDMPLSTPWFAEQEEGLAAVGVIGFPPLHPVMETLRKLSEDPATVMPWDGDYEIAAKRQFAIDVPEKSERRKRAAWGTAGPEGFTRALRHFGLMGNAAPPSSIYPLHYTVWRHCYNGTYDLQSDVLKDSWGIHLWGELLRREPDAIEYFDDNSIIAQAADKYGMPSFYKARVCWKKTDILVGICSCTSPWAKIRRDTVRETWLRYPQPGIECLFFVGGNEPIEKDEERDTVRVNSDDSYHFLPKKVLEFFRYALKHYDFEWLFKCDEDTYLALDRLKDLADPEYDMIGDMSLSERGAPSGGAGYFLSRSLVQKIVDCDHVRPTGAEDIIFGQLAAELGARPLATERLYMANSKFPLPENDMVSSHWCSPVQIKAIDAFYHQQPVSRYAGKHEIWEDTLFFYENGIFRREKSGCSGVCELYEYGVNLKWFSWQEEQLAKVGDKNAATGFALSMMPGEKSLEELYGQQSSQEGFSMLVHFGEGNFLKGWINFKDFDFPLPLPWPEDSINAIYVEPIKRDLCIPEFEGFLREAKRVLKKDGMIRIACVAPPAEGVEANGMIFDWSFPQTRHAMHAAGFSTIPHESENRNPQSENLMDQHGIPFPPAPALRVDGKNS